MYHTSTMHSLVQDCFKPSDARNEPFYSGDWRLLQLQIVAPQTPSPPVSETKIRPNRALPPKRIEYDLLQILTLSNKYILLPFEHGFGFVRRTLPSQISHIYCLFIQPPALHSHLSPHTSITNPHRPSIRGRNLPCRLVFLPRSWTILHTRSSIFNRCFRWAFKNWHKITHVSHTHWIPISSSYHINRDSLGRPPGR